jgi:hypothetical protein
MAKTKVDATHSTHTGINLPMPGRAPKRRADGGQPGNPQMTSLPSDGAGNDGSPKKSQMIADMARIMADMPATSLAELHAALTDDLTDLEEEVDVEEKGGGQKVIRIKSDDNKKKDEGDNENDGDDDENENDGGDENDDENDDGEGEDDQPKKKPPFFQKEHVTLDREDIAEVLGKHSAALFEGETGLSEEFKRKAATIFEAAVLETVNAFAPKYEDAVAEARDAIVEQLDGYCDVTVNEWLDRNEIALESSLQVEIAQQFFSGLRQLYEECNVSVPEEKRDLVAEQADEIDELQEAFSNLERQYRSTQRRLESLQREAIVRAECADLTESQTSKILEMVKELPFDEGSFSGKVKVIRENYFADRSPVLVEHDDGLDTRNVEQKPQVTKQLDETFNRLSPYRGRR